MLKRSLIIACIGLLFIPTAFAKQFSECSPENGPLLQQAFQNLLALYPIDIQNDFESGASTIPQTHDYGDLRIDGRFIFKGEERVQGVMVNYFLHKKDADLPKFAEDVKQMKAHGILGVSLEVPWYEYEGADNNFTPPTYIERALDIIEENKLYSTLLLSPHYTPDWFFEKHGDVYMHRPDQTPVIWDNVRKRVPESGAYMTYSPFAEAATAEQIEFETHAVLHYEQRPSMVAIFLSNEQAYPKEIAVDYSSFAATAWQKYLNDHNQAVVPLPVERGTEIYRLFEYFLQDGLNNFHNKIVTAIQLKQKTEVPVSDRLLLYESLSDNAHKYHQRPLLSQSPSTIVANDIYGFTPNVFALQYSAEKPILVAETNMLGVCDQESMQDYLLAQFLHGSSILSVFKWEKGNDNYSLLNPDGTIKDRAKGVFNAAQTINALTTLQYPAITQPLALDRDDVLDAATNQQRVDSDKEVETAWTQGMMPALSWYDELQQPAHQPFNAGFIIWTAIGVLLGAVALKFLL